MCIVTTGVTLAEMSAAAASAWPLRVVGGDGVERRRQLLGELAHLHLRERHRVEELLLDVGAVRLGHRVQLVERRVAQGAHLHERVVAVTGQSCFSCVGETDGSVRPAKLTSSLALPRAPTAIGSGCTVPKQPDRCLA